MLLLSVGAADAGTQSSKAELTLGEIPQVSPQCDCCSRAQQCLYSPVTFLQPELLLLPSEGCSQAAAAPLAPLSQPELGPTNPSAAAHSSNLSAAHSSWLLWS